MKAEYETLKAAATSEVEEMYTELATMQQQRDSLLAMLEQLEAEQVREASPNPKTPNLKTLEP